MPLPHNVYMTGKRDTLENRLWVKIDKRSQNECWPWLANKNNQGYGMIRLGGKSKKVLAHRVVFTLCKGTIPPKMVVMHLCDNPICCNPHHLRLGTMYDNTQDMISKGRKVVVINPNNKPPHHRGEGHPMSKLKESDVIKIRQLIAEGESQRALSRQYGVTKTTIQNIRKRVLWSHI